MSSRKAVKCWTEKENAKEKYSLVILHYCIRAHRHGRLIRRYEYIILIYWIRNLRFIRKKWIAPPPSVPLSLYFFLSLCLCNPYPFTQRFVIVCTRTHKHTHQTKAQMSETSNIVKNSTQNICPNFDWCSESYNFGLAALAACIVLCQMCNRMNEWAWVWELDPLSEYNMLYIHLILDAWPCSSMANEVYLSNSTTSSQFPVIRSSHLINIHWVGCRYVCVCGIPRYLQ